jgi:hypothetical protein
MNKKISSRTASNMPSFRELLLKENIGDIQLKNK